MQQCGFENLANEVCLNVLLSKLDTTPPVESPSAVTPPTLAETKPQLNT